MKSIASICLLIFLACRQQADADVRQPAVAGMFYPADKTELQTMIGHFLKNAKPAKPDGSIVGLWAPHAGYIYSGQVAAHAYQSIAGMNFDAVILIGPSHRIPLNGASIGDWEAYRTPLGDMPIDVALARSIREASPEIRCISEAHLQEHALEVQIPFLQTVIPNTPIVPIIVGQLTGKQCQDIAETIVHSVQKRHVLLVVSSDMSHYPSAQDAEKVDREILNAVGTFDPMKVIKADDAIMRQQLPNLACTLCGRSALITVMMACKMLGADQAAVLPHMHSGEVSGDNHRVVGYGAALFYRSETSDNQQTMGGDVEDIPLTADESAQLFRIARESITAALKHDKAPQFHVTDEHLLLKRGVFVTLMNRGQLRGCIGRFDASLSLYQIVSEMASAAAVHDTRFMFNPVTMKELPSLDIKISILSELQPIQSIDEIEIGKHGIWIVQGHCQGTYLPEVATELGWNREEFLSHCCAEKAGLAPDAWKHGAEIFIYTSQILDEKEFGKK